uniref:Uncharacterized protein n=1 Tax=Mycena chlorophos TaxID=658473 RepID=A0ABQ0L9M4_MYCCL|nr:predicted protein [Mycena chlorophos]
MKENRRKPIVRTPSASEIARSVKHFETWSTHQNLYQVSFRDVPRHFKEVKQVFTLSSKLPLSWLDPSGSEYKALVGFVGRDFAEFLQQVYSDCPHLFANVPRDEVVGLLPKMTTVHLAWQRLKAMIQNKSVKYSEADYVANVYNALRTPAVRHSTYKVQTCVSLPQPTVLANMSGDVNRILGAKQATPDCLLLIPARSLRSLSNGMKSPYHVLSRHPSVVSCGTASKGSSFRFQATPLAALSETRGFEFISSVWEDKKPVHHMLADAYRQNRMATAAATRHLHSHHVHAPVFGLVWASGTVRAHVDWCSEASNATPPIVYSAPYQRENRHGRESLSDDDSDMDVFHEWQLERAGDIVEVFFLCEHIDEWTIKGFKQRVIAGVGSLVEDVTKNGMPFMPWKRTGELMAVSSKENTTISASSMGSSAESSPAQVQKRRR